MAWPLVDITRPLVVFTLVLARVGGLFAIAPLLGTAEVPARIRALLAVALALLVTPLAWQQAADVPRTPADYARLAAAEALVGLALGLGVLLFFAGLQVAGQIIGQLSGMQLADVLSPGFDSGVPVFSQLFYLVALAVFLALSGHRLMVESLLETFRSVPPGAVGLPTTVVDTLTLLMSQSLALGIRAAAPAMVALLLATLVLGLVGRTLPQLNVLALGFGLNALVTCGAMAVSLGAAAYLLHNQVEAALAAVADAFATR